MKIFYSIFTFYILYLVCLPCVDQHTLSSLNVQEQSATEKHNDHQNTDSCTPFCVCTCCSVHVVLENFILQSKPSIVFQIHYISISSAETVFSPFIWQPPKIG